MCKLSIILPEGSEKVKQHEKEIDVICRKYYKDVLFFALSLSGNRDVAEEITQNTFCKAIQSVNKFRGECDIRIWLCQIAKYDYLNYIRKEKHIATDCWVEDVLSNMQDDKEPALNRIVDEESAREICLILDGMEEPYKEVFTLRVLHELPYYKISEIYGKTESWARVIYYRAKMKILDSLKRM